MPVGGGDVGMNVWVEQGDVLFYLSRSGSFDENNTLLKLGRWRVHLSEPFRAQSLCQQLVLADGYWQVSDGRLLVQLWADTEKPVVHVSVSSTHGAVGVEVTYESWRTQPLTLTKRERFQTSYKFAAPRGLQTRPDSIVAMPHSLTFFHHNADSTIFDATVAQQQLQPVKDQLVNPLRRLTFGGRMQGEGFRLKGHTRGRYASADYEGWTYATQRPRRHCELTVTLAAHQGTIGEWQQLLEATQRSVNTPVDRKTSRQWWRQFWQRSYVEATDGPAAPLARNYTLFRYMLGCNSRGQWPTKFNGGLFTFDPEYVNAAEEYRLSPDFRNWGGGVHTAQNQRLVYWPMLKNGDFDLLLPQLDFYRYVLPNAELRSRHYWGHGGACLTEQMENYGLPCYAEYGTKRPAGFDPGMERNAWLEYEWDTCLEFCQMALELHRYAGTDITAYLPLVRSCLQFFDEHYQYLALQRGAKRLDGNGRLVLYPGSGGETYKGAYNSASTIAALRTVAAGIGDTALLKRLPDLPLTEQDGRRMLAPAQLYERIQNVESTQLYPVFPWRIYGIGRPDLQVARDTYQHDSLAVRFRSHVGWKQDLIFAACLGLTDEAARLCQLKMGDGPHRFPAFWGPGYDWTPDHNWGGSGMVGMQEMLLQEVGQRLYLFPAWPKEWNVRFRLHASGGTVVEAEMRDGRPRLVSITPAARAQDVVLQ
ncbi:MAG: hypothetical protein IJ710_08265 [Prevotella sp.]|nr:hypothetical protein [Prevotella sp.]